MVSTHRQSDFSCDSHICLFPRGYFLLHSKHHCRFLIYKHPIAGVATTGHIVECDGPSSDALGRVTGSVLLTAG